MGVRLAALRLALHPLSGLIFSRLPSQQLLAPLAGNTTLFDVSASASWPHRLAAQLAVQLKSIPTLSSLRLHEFPIDEGLQLLQTRKNEQHRFALSTERS